MANLKDLIVNGSARILGTLYANVTGTLTGNASTATKATTVNNSRDSSSLTYWTGTSAQYEAITTKDNNTLYNITDDTDITLTLLETIYPVGSIYITTNSTCPLAALFGTWTLVGADRVLQGAGTRGSVGTTLEESLPNITGEWSADVGNNVHPWATTKTGVFSSSTTGTWYDPSSSGTSYANKLTNLVFNASNSSSTYQNNAPVQPDAYLVNIYRRVS